MPSTAIRNLSYDAQTGTLFVTFVDGDLYAYAAVPETVNRAFERARSKGGYFARHVRGRYAYRRMAAGGEPSPSAPPGGPAWPPPAGAAH